MLMLLAMGVVWALMPQRSVALAQELVDNPVYQSWAKGKPGTTVTLSQEIIAMGSMRRMDMTSKLVELTPAKAVVETTSKNIESNSQTTTKAEVRAKVKKQDVVGTLTMEPGIKVKLLPDEDVTVGGKTYKCKVFEWTGELRGMNTSGKGWACQEVPGQMVKSEGNLSALLETTAMVILKAVDVK